MKSHRLSCAVLSLALPVVVWADGVTLRDGERAEGSIFSVTASRLYLVAPDGLGRHIAIKDIADYTWRGKKQVLGAVTPRPASQPAAVASQLPATTTQPVASRTTELLEPPQHAPGYSDLKKRIPSNHTTSGTKSTVSRDRTTAHNSSSTVGSGGTGSRTGRSRNYGATGGTSGPPHNRSRSR